MLDAVDDNAVACDFIQHAVITDAQAVFGVKLVRRFTSPARSFSRSRIFSNTRRAVFRSSAPRSFTARGLNSTRICLPPIPLTPQTFNRTCDAILALRWRVKVGEGEVSGLD